jgi:hypothetical protein
MNRYKVQVKMEAAFLDLPSKKSFYCRYGSAFRGHTELYEAR